MVCTTQVNQEKSVVFDCSAQFAGKSLNEKLLTGPDLTNPILGVLIRFGKVKLLS